MQGSSGTIQAEGRTDPKPRSPFHFLLGLTSQSARWAPGGSRTNNHVPYLRAMEGGRGPSQIPRRNGNPLVRFDFIQISHQILPECVQKLVPVHAKLPQWHISCPSTGALCIQRKIGTSLTYFLKILLKLELNMSVKNAEKKWVEGGEDSPTNFSVTVSQSVVEAVPGARGKACCWSGVLSVTGQSRTSEI